MGERRTSVKKRREERDEREKSYRIEERKIKREKKRGKGENKNGEKEKPKECWQQATDIRKMTEERMRINKRRVYCLCPVLS